MAMWLKSGALLGLNIQPFQIAPRRLRRRRFGREIDGVQPILARAVRVTGQAADDAALQISGNMVGLEA